MKNKTQIIYRTVATYSAIDTLYEVGVRTKLTKVPVTQEDFDSLVKENELLKREYSDLLERMETVHPLDGEYQPW